MSMLTSCCHVQFSLCSAVLVLCTHSAGADSRPIPSPQGLEIVRGIGCYSYSDNETPTHAKRTAMALAQEQAVRNHRVFVESTSTVRNLQLEDDLIQTVSAGMLEQIRVENEEKKGQEICITMTAKLSPVSFEDLIQQRTNAKQIAQAAQAPLMPQSQGYGLKVWVDKKDGHYVEGERIVVYIQSERDAYLKLDYFMADGCVLHLVPNKYRGQELVRGGKEYSFGGDVDPERIRITSPFGAETIKAMLSAMPIDTRENEVAGGCDDSRTYLKQLESGIKKKSRGASLTGADRSVGLVTTSKAVDHYTKDRKALQSEK